MYALKAKESKRQYPRRFKMFLDYLKIEGTTINEQAKQLLINTKNNPQWTEQMLMDFEDSIKFRACSSALYCFINGITVNYKN
jgi:hypothetical protein